MIPAILRSSVCVLRFDSGTDQLALQEAGGWASPAMPRRYVERAKIANDRVKLQT